MVGNSNYTYKYILTEYRIYGISTVFNFFSDQVISPISLVIGFNEKCTYLCF